jgi:hypothetical protein
MQARTQTLWQRMLGIDRRWLYLILFVNIVTFLVAPIRMPASISPPVQKFYDEIEKLQPGDLVMISSNWSASTLAENQPQLEAVIAHLMRKQARFTIISIEAQSRDISYRLAERVTKEKGYQYGEQWAHFGFVPNLDRRHQRHGDRPAWHHQARCARHRGHVNCPSCKASNR